VLDKQVISIYKERSIKALENEFRNIDFLEKHLKDSRKVSAKSRDFGSPGEIPHANELYQREREMERNFRSEL
jgi:hypothetical protein